MTFALKDFEYLKKHFNDCVEFVLKRDHKEKIADLPSRRRDELQFLTTVIAELDKQIAVLNIDKQLERVKIESRADKRAELLKPYVNILYGAMLITNQDIVKRMHSGESTSKVLDRLNIAMGLDKGKPSDTQFDTFFKSINNFLNLIYADNDSRKGFKKEHILQTVPALKLVQFAKIGFELEEATQKTIHVALPFDGKSQTDGSWYKPAQSVSALIVAPFTSFAALKKSLHQLIIAETADKNSAAISELDTKRAAQLQFLDNLAQSLSESKADAIQETEKMAILAGAMHIVRGQIAIEYKYEPLTHTDFSPTMMSNGSIVHTELTKILNAKTTSVQDIEALIFAANQYIHHLTIEKTVTKSASVEAIRTKHLFSEISGFSLVTILELAQNMIRSCRDKAIDFCLGELNKEIKEQEALLPQKPSYFASIYNMWGTSKKPVVVEDDNDVEDQIAATIETEANSKGHFQPS
ncbi:hypothetical protein [uncultured Legionella sp.]|uniref:hypothetical protein n=1 Tax=uncultured Legionella sp. TaxID=210934 RepID=UPI0026304498|nr:hypothetical protein [uncultured Legionella sp.]